MIIKPFYDLLEEYSKEEIDIAISKLDEEDKDLIKEKYGEDLKNPHPSKEWTNEKNIVFFNRTLRRLKNLLGGHKKRNVKTIYAYFSNYSKEDINKAIEKLSDECKRILELRFGPDLENPKVSPLWTKEHMQKFHKLVIRNLEKILLNKPPVKPIYELFNGYSKEQVDAMILTLDSEEKNLINKRYGEDLNNPKTSKSWTKKDHDDFYKKLVPKMRKRIVKLNKTGKTIYSYFPEFSKEQVDEGIKKLSSDEIYQITVKFNYKSNVPCLITDKEKLNFKFDYNIIRKLYFIIRKIYGLRKIKTIYELMSEFSKEDVNIAISNLSEEEKNIITLRYGTDLEHPVTSPRWNKETAKQFQLIIDRVRFRLKNGNVRVHAYTIYDYFKEISKEKVNTILMGLTYDEKVLIYLRFGRDLNNPTKSPLWDKKLSQDFQGLINRIKTKIRKAKDIEETLIFEEDEDFQKIIAEHSFDEKKNCEEPKLYIFENIGHLLTEQEIELINLRYNKNYSIKDAAQILNITTTEASILLKRAIYLYKKDRLERLNSKELDESLKRTRQKKNLQTQE